MCNYCENSKSNGIGIMLINEVRCSPYDEYTSENI